MAHQEIFTVANGVAEWKLPEFFRRGMTGYKSNAAKVFMTALEAEKSARRSGVGATIYRVSGDPYSRAQLDYCKLGSVTHATFGAKRSTVVDLTWEGGRYL